jgi:hypothetical protein
MAKKHTPPPKKSAPKQSGSAVANMLMGLGAKKPPGKTDAANKARRSQAIGKGLCARM